MDDLLFRKAMGKFATGVTVITTEVEGEVHGMTANAFMSVSLDPKLILISVGNKAKMCDYIKKSQSFAVNILGDDQRDLSMLFAGQVKEKKEIEFDEFEETPVIKESLVSLSCRVYNSYEAGDHVLFVGEVKNLHVKDGDPLAFFEGKYKQIS
ncbi:flavin reductase [Bacillaceae bacterium JMAK1]|nr:flavin reductase [Bacillaceae bacterium JMAK1]